MSIAFTPPHFIQGCSHLAPVGDREGMVIAFVFWFYIFTWSWHTRKLRSGL